MSLSVLPTSGEPLDGSRSSARIRPGSPEPLGDSLRVVPWEDPVVERIGFTPLSRYVELFWLPVLGPSACLLLRRMADLLIEHPQGTRISTEDTARALGLGGVGGRHAPFPRALGRCVRYGLARRPDPETVAFRRLVGPLPLRLVRRLPPALQPQHDAWQRELEEGEGAAQLVRRTRLIALELACGAHGPDSVTNHLHAIGVHPALAGEAVRWVGGALPDETPEVAAPQSAQASTSASAPASSP
jgi:hypothetical protein